MSANTGNERALPRPWVQSPQVTDGQTEAQRGNFSESRNEAQPSGPQGPWSPAPSACLGYCVSPGRSFGSEGPEVERVGSGGELSLFTHFGKDLGPQQQPPFPSPAGKGLGVEAAADSFPGLHTPSPSGQSPDPPHLGQPSCMPPSPP